MTISGKVDFADVFKGLDGLTKIKTSLARSMAVAGGQVLRDEAKARAPRESGKLASSIYLAFRDKQSTATHTVYSVSWSVPHGHLLEFGHWRYNTIVNGFPQKSLVNGKKRGDGPQSHGGPGALNTPVWVAAHPFLRPAMDSAGERAVKAMIQRGKDRLPELLRDQYSDTADFE